MKKLTKFLSITCLTLYLLVTPRSKAWETSTHELIMDHAINMVGMASSDAGCFISIGLDEEELYNGLKIPTEKRDDPCFHYYLTLTGFEKDSTYCNRLLMDLPSYETARTRLDYHYQKALKLYLEGDPCTASLHLGSACHYLQDICCPSHTAIGTERYNKAYEKYCDRCTNRVDINMRRLIYETRELNYKHVKKLSSKWDEVISSTAEVSASYKGALLSNQKDKWDDSFIKTLRLSEKRTAALLWKFFLDLRERGGVKRRTRFVNTDELEAALFETFKHIKNKFWENMI